MKGAPKMVQLLNDVLAGELTAINQYFLGAKLCQHRGYARLHAKLYAESIDEMKHADRLIDRILLLGGLPNVQKLERVRVADSPVTQLKHDHELERRAVERLRDAATLARKDEDHGTADLLEQLLIGAEGHADWLATQLALVEQLGETAYLTQQIRD